MIINLPKDTVNNGKNEYKYHSRVIGDNNKNKEKARKKLGFMTPFEYFSLFRRNKKVAFVT